MFDSVVRSSINAETQVKVLGTGTQDFECVFRACTSSTRKKGSDQPNESKLKAECKEWKINREGYTHLGNITYGPKGPFNGGWFSGKCYPKGHPELGKASPDIQENEVVSSLRAAHQDFHRYHPRPTPQEDVQGVVYFHLLKPRNVDQCHTTRLFFEAFATAVYKGNLINS